VSGGPLHCESCGAPIAQLPGPGRPRRFCGDACRQRAHHDRWSGLIGFLGAGPELLPELDASLSDEQLGLPDNADEAVLEAVSEALALAVKLDRVADRARPEFVPHLRRTASVLARSLERWSHARPLHDSSTGQAHREPGQAASGDERLTV